MTDPTSLEARVRDSFDRQATMALIGARLAYVGKGEVTLELPFDARLTQQHGFLHAGISSTLMDTAAGYAAYTLMPAEAEVLTVEFKVNLLRPAKGALFQATGRVLKPGRSLMVVEARLVAAEAPDRPLALLNATMMVVLDRPDVAPASKL